jgi:hypothetical protein
MPTIPHFSKSASLARSALRNSWRRILRVVVIGNASTNSPTWRRFKLGWALRQHTAEIVPSGIDSASGKKQEVSWKLPGGEVLFMPRALFSRSCGLAVVGLFIGASAAHRAGGE